MRRHRSITLAITVAATLMSVATAGAVIHRTVNGPASVVPGHVYTFHVSGFSPGELIYPTVVPVFCAGGSGAREPARSSASTLLRLECREAADGSRP